LKEGCMKNETLLLREVCRGYPLSLLMRLSFKIADPLTELDGIALALDYIKPRCRAQIEAS
jgi:hypothetical protein